MRGLEQYFIDDLKHGKLRALCDEVRKDSSLQLCIRDNYINIYYKGGNITKVEPKVRKKAYQLSFDTKYKKNSKITDFENSLTDRIIASDNNDTVKWVHTIATRKTIMDKWFKEYSNKEREIQQLICLHNNTNKNCYYIVDVEYAIRIKKIRGSASAKIPRIDMVAVKITPEVIIPVLIELKYGVKAINGASGIKEHLDDIEIIIRDKLDEIIISMKN